MCGSEDEMAFNDEKLHGGRGMRKGMMRGRLRCSEGIKSTK